MNRFSTVKFLDSSGKSAIYYGETVGHGVAALRGCSIDSCSVFIGLWAVAPTSWEKPSCGVKFQGFEHFHAGYTFVGKYDTKGGFLKGELLTAGLLMTGSWKEDAFTGSVVKSTVTRPNPWATCYPDYFGGIRLQAGQQSVSQQVLLFLNAHKFHLNSLNFVCNNVSPYITSGVKDELKFYYNSFVETLNKKMKAVSNGLRTQGAETRVNALIFETKFDIIFNQYKIAVMCEETHF
jgi:hypothetical protein